MADAVESVDRSSRLAVHELAIVIDLYLLSFENLVRISPLYQSICEPLDWVADSQRNSLAVEIMDRYLNRVVAAGDDDDVGLCQVVGLLAGCISSHQLDVGHMSFTNRHPQILGFASDSSKRVHDSSLAQVQVLVEILVCVVASFCDTCEMNFDLLPVNHLDLVMRLQKRPCRRGWQGRGRKVDPRLAEAAARYPTEAFLVTAVSQLVRARYAVVAHFELVALWPDGRELVRQLRAREVLVLHFKLVELVLELLLCILEEADSGRTVDEQSHDRES